MLPSFPVAMRGVCVKIASSEPLKRNCHTRLPRRPRISAPGSPLPNRLQRERPSARPQNATGAIASRADCEAACDAADGLCTYDTADGAVELEMCLTCPDGCSSCEGVDACKQGCGFAFGEAPAAAAAAAAAAVTLA